MALIFTAIVGDYPSASLSLQIIKMDLASRFSFSSKKERVVTVLIIYG
jgi:hypothetical protein